MKKNVIKIVIAIVLIIICLVLYYNINESNIVEIAFM